MDMIARSLSAFYVWFHDVPIPECSLSRIAEIIAQNDNAISAWNSNFFFYPPSEIGTIYVEGYGCVGWHVQLVLCDNHNVFTSAQIILFRHDESTHLGGGSVIRFYDRSGDEIVFSVADYSLHTARVSNILRLSYEEYLRHNLRKFELLA